MRTCSLFLVLFCLVSPEVVLSESCHFIWGLLLLSWCLYNGLVFLPSICSFSLSVDYFAFGLRELHPEGKELLIKRNHAKVYTPHMTEHLDSLGRSKGRQRLLFAYFRSFSSKHKRMSSWRLLCAIIIRKENVDGFGRKPLFFEDCIFFLPSFLPTAHLFFFSMHFKGRGSFPFSIILMIWSLETAE